MITPRPIRMIGAVASLLAGLATVVVYAAGARAPEMQRTTFRVGVDLVNVGVTVIDKRGHLVTDLREGDLEIYEDGKKQQVTFFLPCEAQADDGDAASRPPLHLGAVFDISGSMDDDLRFARSAAVKFLKKLDDAVDYTVADFDSEVRVARFSQAEFPRLVERLRSRKADGNTALWDAVGVYLDGAQEQDGRKILVLYTDGGDNASNLRFPELLDLLKASDATVHVVGFLQHLGASARFDQQVRLQQIADATGGQAFFPLTMKDLDQAYDKVVAEIDAQYGLGYFSSNPRADGTWRRVEIRLARDGLKDVKMRSRQGYFAPLRAGSSSR